MPAIEAQDDRFTYSLIRSSRKTFSIEVHPDGQVLVRAPQRSTRAQIDQIVQSKADWIQAKRREAARRSQAAEVQPVGKLRFQPGELFYYLGERLPLQVVDRAPKAFSLNGSSFVLRKADIPQAARLIENWYKDQARQLFTRRLEYYAAKHNLHYRQVRLSSARTRWGSCGPNGTINLTWRLIMAPLATIDYVVAHELTHLEVRDHSARFWKRLEQIYPDYRTQRLYLKAHSADYHWIS